MLATRLEKPGEIMVLPKPVVAKALAQQGWKGYSEQAARAVGKAVGAAVCRERHADKNRQGRKH